MFVVFFLFQIICFSHRFRILTGWFGLRRDLCEILLDYCPFLPLYFNNQFKFPPPRTSNNELIIDLTGKKNVDISNTNKRTSIIDINDEKNLIKQDQFFSLLQPD